MSHPPSRADQVRQSIKSTAQSDDNTNAIEQSDENLRPNAWFAYVTPVQSGVQMMASGRYGYWEEQPSYFVEGDTIVISGKSADEPVFIAPKASVVTISIAQAKHVSAYPIPQVDVQETN